MYKTITLGGAEQQVKVAGQNCDVRNDGAETIYASAKPNVTAGADGVLSIPMGQAAKLLDCRGTVYLLGTGSVLICGNDYSELVFKTAATSSGEGGTVDELARTMATANTTSIAQMKPVTENVSNDNLLDNPDLSINQRGVESWSPADEQQVYIVDRWYAAKCTADKLASGGISLAWNGTVGDSGWIQQKIPTTELFGKVVTISADLNGERHSLTITVPTTADKTVGGAANEDGSILFAVSNHGNNLMSVVVFSKVTTPITIENIKLELGSVATPFIPPNPATELAKCQRYHNKHTIIENGIYGIALAQTDSNAKILISLPTSMRALPTLGVDPAKFELYDGANSIEISDIAIHTFVKNRTTLSVTASGLTVGKTYFLRAKALASMTYSADL